MENIIYREIMPEEVPAIVRKFGEYVREYSCIRSGDSSHALAAFHGEQPVGFISAHVESLIPPLEDKEDFLIDAIEVDSAFRRRGIARKLIEKTEEWAKKRGYRQIRSWSSDDKKEAISMWYAEGYCMCPALMYGEDLCPNEDGSRPAGYYVVKMLNPGTEVR